MVSPEPYPVTPSSVSTRTRVASKARRGTGSQAARNGGSSGSRIRSSRIAVIFTAALCPAELRIGTPPLRRITLEWSKADHA